MKMLVLHSYNNYIAAHIALGHLQNEGISCWLRNEISNTMLPLWDNFDGGIQLIIHQKDFEKASTILNAIDDKLRK